jgi:putative transcriptional regulator
LNNGGDEGTITSLDSGPSAVIHDSLSVGDLTHLCHLTLAALSAYVGVTVVNLSILKNNRAKAIRFTTLTAICDALGCQPADLFSVQPQQ